MAPWRRAWLTLLAMLSVGVGGAAGAFGRHGLASAISDPSVALLAANALGCTLMGWAASALRTAVRAPFAGGARVSAWQGVTVGFCGGVTTFSTLALTIADRLNSGRVASGLGYLGITTAICAVMFGVGKLAWSRRRRAATTIGVSR